MKNEIEKTIRPFCRPINTKILTEEELEVWKIQTNKEISMRKYPSIHFKKLENGR